MEKLKKYAIYFAFFGNLALIIGLWWIISGGLIESGDLSAVLLALGRLAGLLAVYFVLQQFLMMGRSYWLEKVFGLDKLTRIHHLNGYLSISFIIIHPILLIFSYSIGSGVSFWAQFMDFLYNYKDVGWAALAALFFILIVFLSIYIVRKHLKYELWYYVHLLTYLAIILAFSHQLNLGGDLTTNKFFYYYWCALYIFVFGNVLLFRFIRPVYNSLKYRFTVSDVVQETPDTTSVYITGKNLEKFKTHAGQFIILRFFCKGFWWQAHPFSLSFVPKNNQLRITVKNCGDFTAKISQLKKGTPTYIDGPYGIFIAHAKPETKYLFIAGGVGITPIRSLIEELAPAHDIIVLFSNKTMQDTIFKKELDELAQTNHFPMHYILTDQKDYPGEKGRLDKEKFQRLVKDTREREVYLCGPIPMLKAMLQLLQDKDIGVKPERIHFEKFEL